MQAGIGVAIDGAELMACWCRLQRGKTIALQRRQRRNF